MNAYGAQSLRALFAAEVDVATVAALPVVYAAMSQSAGASDAPPPFRIIANLLRSSQLNNVVARGDRSILAPRDLNGRSIALTRGTASEYFWAMFVLANGIDRASVRVVDAAPPDLLAALHDGKVDAIVAWEPLVSDLRENARFPVVVLTSPEAYITAWISVVRADRLAALSGRLERYLSALLAAEQWIATDPDAAVAVHSARIGVPPARLAGIYREVNFAMSLDEGLIHNLELQSLWASEQGRAGGLPDYRAMVASRLLARVKPGSVGLLR
ncbi:MAG: ABC transporter substrate-binding protein [Burkholderiaceae bacterium]|nr:ABC transporter substrate-binding protein [Burkholderiaceae bacterium]